MSAHYTLAWAFDPWTYALVAIVALLLFGKRLPEVGRSLGRGIAEFKKGLRDVTDEMSRDEPETRPDRKLDRPPGDDEAVARRRLESGGQPAESKDAKRDDSDEPSPP